MNTSLLRFLLLVFLLGGDDILQKALLAGLVSLIPVAGFYLSACLLIIMQGPGLVSLIATAVVFAVIWLFRFLFFHSQTRMFFNREYLFFIVMGFLVGMLIAGIAGGVALPIAFFGFYLASGSELLTRRPAI